MQRLKEIFPNGRVHCVPHHLTHGMYAYAASGFDSSAVLIIDSLGETCTTSIAAAVTRAGGDVGYRIAETISDPASLGYAYGAVTAHLGWRRGDEEGTVMALSALGDPAQFRAVLARAIPLTDTGFALDPAMFPPRVLRHGWPRVTPAFAAATCPARRKDEDVTQVHADLSAALQERTEQVMVHIVFLQANRDLSEADHDLRDRYAWDAGLPPIDALFLEWRWPVPGRSTTPCGSPGHTCDLHRQDELVTHYTLGQQVPTIVWDKDLQLPAGSPLRSVPNVAVCDAALAPSPGAVGLLFPVADDDLERADPVALAAMPRLLPLVVAAFCLYHASSPVSVIAEIARCLLTGGTAIIAVKSADSYRELDQLMARSGLDPRAESRPSLYQAAHSGNIESLASASLDVRQVTHETHRFLFPALTDVADYLSTSPKYDLPPGLAADPAALAAALRQRMADDPVTATSIVTYLTAVRAPAEVAS
jgi:hypothetical protein